jgi:two-component system response regulator FlrC
MMSGRPKVIVVDNHSEVREVLSGVLEALSYDTCQADGYTQAIEQLGKPGIRAVVTDVEMEPKTGFDLLATCRQKHPELPVILVSSYANDDMRKRAMLGGAAKFLAKPFSMEDINDALEESIHLTTV